MFQMTVSHHGDNGVDSKLEIYGSDIVYGASGVFKVIIYVTNIVKLMLEVLLLDGKNYIVMLLTKVPRMEHLVSILSAIWLQLNPISKEIAQDNSKLTYRQEQRRFDPQTNQQFTPQYSNMQFLEGNKKISAEIINRIAHQKIFKRYKKLKIKIIDATYPTLNVPQYL